MEASVDRWGPGPGIRWQCRRGPSEVPPRSGLEQPTTTEVPQAACRGAHPVAGQRHTMWSAGLTHLTLCALFRFRGVDHLPARLTLSPARQGPSG